MSADSLAAAKAAKLAAQQRGKLVAAVERGNAIGDIAQREKAVVFDKQTGQIHLGNFVALDVATFAVVSVAVLVVVAVIARRL